MDTDEYYDIIDSEAFKEMPVYPAEGSLENLTIYWWSSWRTRPADRLERRTAYAPC